MYCWMNQSDIVMLPKMYKVRPTNLYKVRFHIKRKLLLNRFLPHLQRLQRLARPIPKIAYQVAQRARLPENCKPVTFNQTHPMLPFLFVFYQLVFQFLFIYRKRARFLVMKHFNFTRWSGTQAISSDQIWTNFCPFDALKYDYVI